MECMKAKRPTKTELRIKRLTVLAEFVDRERFRHDSQFEELTDGLCVLRNIIKEMQQ